MAHSIPEPRTIMVPESGIIAEPRICEKLPGFGSFKPQIMISVTHNLFLQCFFQFFFFTFDFYRIVISFMSPMEPYLPSVIRNDQVLLPVLQYEGVIFVSRIKGQKIKSGFRSVIFFQFHNLPKIP